MREILFRGKRTNTGEWVEGYFCKTRIEDTCYIAQSAGGDCCNEYFRDYEVNPETVGQFTGLYCKGKKIFEGDIIKATFDSEHFELLEVIYNTELCRFELKESKTGEQLEMYIEEIHEIIGNIHDNPELLNERDDK